MPHERWQLESLDALRGIAIIGVLLVHSAYWGPTEILSTHYHLLNDILFSGQRGVQLFFLVSAFALYLSNDNRRKEAHPTLNFFIRRAFRLSPMFYVATALGVLFWRDAMGNSAHIALSMLYLNNFSPALINQGAPGSWSISTEAVFYMALPFAFRHIRTATHAGLAVFLGVCVRHFSAGHFPTHPDYWLYQSFQANICVFGMGIMLYLLWRDHLRAAVGTPEAKAWSAAILFTVSAFYLELSPRSPFILAYGGGLCFLLAASLLLYPWKALVNRATVLMGKISFSFYLLHFQVMHVLERHLRDYQASQARPLSEPALIATVFFVTLVTTAAASFLTWRYIEEPCIRLGKRLIQHLEGRHAVSSFAGEQF